jgi:hypothetical protein
VTLVQTECAKPKIGELSAGAGQGVSLAIAKILSSTRYLAAFYEEMIFCLSFNNLLIFFAIGYIVWQRLTSRLCRTIFFTPTVILSASVELYMQELNFLKFKDGIKKTT